MRERPIIFSGAMVRAILDGQKTQTRRVMKEADAADAVFPDGSGTGFIAWYGQGPFTAEDTARRYPGDQGIRCPFGRPGDRLWVREAWKYVGWTEDGIPWIGYAADGSKRLIPSSRIPIEWHERLEDVWMHLSDPNNFAIDQRAADRRWRPSIHMPRWASRLTLEVVSVRVERLQDITPDDARAEGHPRVPGTENYPQEVHDEAAREWFLDLWDTLNAHRYSWESNPWVWCVTFKRVES